VLAPSGSNVNNGSQTPPPPSLTPPPPSPSLCLSRLAHQSYVYPQAFVQPSMVLPSQLSAALGSSPYLDYSAAYSHYAQAAFEQQYPYAASPAGFLSYGYATSPPAGGGGPVSAAAAPAGVHATLPSAAGPAQAFLHYAPQQHIQPDRMQ